ncbi:integration host factor, actinobacterial type [Yaniella flava]|uniref:Integration host factor, actinobacterial type n=1 Tax=Yaniella flava TaxID=287930 RepID=A0ABN2UCV5_9MICC|nr:DNA-binding protein [Micrococcaceae bacterium]
MVLKDLTPAERQAARQKALDARTARAKVKTEFSDGTISLSQVFERADSDEAVARMRTIDLLTSLKGIGEIRAQTIMEQCDISANRRLRGLGHRQRTALREALGR